jgi:hypothetical protein
MLRFVVPLIYAVSPPLVYGIIRNRMDRAIPLYKPNQRARRLEPKCSLSTRNAAEGS